MSKVAGWIGLVAHLAVGFLYVVTGLAAPAWAVAVLIAIWLILLSLAVYLLRTKPIWVLAIPVAAVAIWFAAISAGDAWLGWTA